MKYKSCLYQVKVPGIAALMVRVPAIEDDHAPLVLGPHVMRPSDADIGRVTPGEAAMFLGRKIQEAAANAATDIGQAVLSYMPAVQWVEIVYMGEAR